MPIESQFIVYCNSKQFHCILPLITIELIFNFTLLLCFLLFTFVFFAFLSIINWNFLGLAFSEFIPNHFKIIFISCCIFLMLDNSIPPLQTMLLSTELRISKFSININRWLIKILKSKGPKTDPWGIPFFTSTRSCMKSLSSYVVFVLLNN